jgi:hypothetical protein
MTKTKTKKSATWHIHNAAKVPPKHRYVTETIGWFGAFFVLLAYIMATFFSLDVHGFAYQVLNLIGALCILTIATAKHVRQSMLVNAFWAIMAAVALLKIIFKF